MTRGAGHRLLVTAALVCTSLEAQAGELQYEAPGGCPADVDVRQQLRSELARRGVAETEAATIVVEGREDGFSGTVVTGSGEDARTRTLQAASCEAVVAGLVTILVFGATAPPSPPMAAPPPAPASPSSPPGPESTASSPRGFARLSGGAFVGLQPRPAAALGVSGGATFGRLLTEVGATASLPDDATLDAGPESATFSSYTLGARACYLVMPRLVLGPCAGAEAVLLHGSGHDAEVVRARTSTTLAPEASIRGGVFATEHLAIGLDGSLLIPLQRPEFTITALDLHRVAPVLWRTTVGVELWF